VPSLGDAGLHGLLVASGWEFFQLLKRQGIDQATIRGSDEVGAKICRSGC